MKTSASFSLGPILLSLLLGTASAYRVTPDVSHVDNKLFTDAVEKVNSGSDVATPSPLLFAQDDHTYSSAPTAEPVPLQSIIKSKSPIPIARRATQRKRWGIDNEHVHDYWFNNRIHTFGNTGFFGGLHAAVAPVATFMIDTLAYEGEDARLNIAKELHASMKKSGARVLDMCCGVGISTRALRKAFHDAEAVIGIDTSPDMITMARAIGRHQYESTKALTMVNNVLKPLVRTKLFLKEMLTRAKHDMAAFVRGNALRTNFPAKSFDLVTIMYAFHEAPRHGRYLILREARRLLQNGGKLALVDICPTYQPSASMLAGEPYVIEYQKNIQKQIRQLAGFADVKFKNVIPGHVVMWELTRKSKNEAAPAPASP